MQIIEAISEERPASRDQLVWLEQRFGARLPDDYVAFLLQHNGGRAAASAFEFSNEDGEAIRSRVDWFFGAGDDESYGLSANIDDYDERIPAGFCPVGSDPFGNVILLCLRPEGYGSIWFWDHENEQEEPDLSNMSRVAGSFSEFLAALR